MTRNRGEPGDRLQRVLRGLMTRPRIRQAILVIESGDRKFRWSGAEGEANPGGTREPSGIPFFIASIDKLLNATVIMKLREEGRLDLNATLPTYLPSLLTRGLHRFNGVDHSERITLRHLLGHTSGIADWLEDAPQGGQPLVDRILREGDRGLNIEDMVAVVRDQLKPHFPPQDLSKKRPKARYSDTNYMLLIAVIEQVTGQPLHRVHEEKLFRPLGLRHTYFAGESGPPDSTPEPTVLRAGGRPLTIPLLIRSVRGIYSTGEDLTTFLRALVSGDLFKDRGTLAAMQERWNRFGFPLDRAALRAPGWPVEYGLGIMRFRLPRLLSPARPMPPVLGHTGSTGCWLFYCPRWDMLIAGTVDEVTAGAVPYRVIPRILSILHSSGMPVADQHSPSRRTVGEF